MKELGITAGQLNEALSKIPASGGRAAQSLGKMAEASMVFQGMTQAVEQLKGAVDSLSQAYAVQQQAETQLETVMRQRMSATAAQIQSIKDLCSAQQELGVIGDEVQLAGAQQLATFLHTDEALKVLIPAMNNLAAQQKGLNASQGDMVSIANLMGKALQGQASALRRVGITFTEAEEAAIKNGNEQQRAAALARIITNNVGEMNAALAATDSGRQKQLANTLGDVQEKFGRVASKVQPWLTMTASITTTANGLILLTKTLGASGRAMLSLVLPAKTAATAIKMVGVAIKGLTVAGGVIALVTTLADVFSSASGKADSLKESTEAAREAQERLAAAMESADSQLAQAQAKYTTFIERLKNFNGTKTEERDLVKALNDEYGTTMGYFNTIAEWYKALTTNADEYIKRLRATLQLQTLQARLADLIKQQNNVVYDENGNKKRYSTVRPTAYVDDYEAPINTNNGDVIYRKKAVETPSPHEMAQQTYDTLQKAIDEVTAAMSAIDVPAGTFTIQGSHGMPQSPENGTSAAAPLPQSPFDFTTYDQFERRIKELTELQRTATAEQYGRLAEQIDSVKRVRDAFADQYAVARELADAHSELADVLPVAFKEIDKSTVSLTDNVRSLGDAIGEAADRSVDFAAGWGNFKSIVNGISTITEALRGEGSAWDKVRASVDGALQVYTAFNQLMPVLQAAYTTLTSLKAAEKAQTDANTTSNIAEAASGSLAAHAKIPFAGIAIGVAAIGVIAAAMAALPKFADGGLAYGPTLGLMGEYAGASSNPEVIAPLDKLKAIINDGDAPGGGLPREIKLVADRRGLVATINLEDLRRGRL